MTERSITTSWPPLPADQRHDTIEVLHLWAQGPDWWLNRSRSQA